MSTINRAGRWAWGDGMVFLLVGQLDGETKAPSIAGGALGSTALLSAHAATTRPAGSGRAGRAGEVAREEIHGADLGAGGQVLSMRCAACLQSPGIQAAQGGAQTQTMERVHPVLIFGFSTSWMSLRQEASLRAHAWIAL